MIEIVCPSCAARYQVPEDSIGAEGRKVTCSSCSHKWRAYPEGVAAASTAEPESVPETSREPVSEPVSEHAPEHASGPLAGAAPGVPADTADTAAAEPADAGDTAGTGEPAGQPPAGGREAQMDAIRRMLDDLKRSTDDGPEPEPDAQRTTRPEPTMRRREEDEVLEDSGDPLRSRIDRIGNEGRTGKEAAPPSNYDAAKLRKMHERRAKRLQKARERKRRSGAFLSGFTLVAVVTTAMVGLYVLQPQIVASSPEMAPAMNEYVVAVDRYRIALDDATAGMREWVTARVEPLLGGEEGQAQDTPPATEPATTTE